MLWEAWGAAPPSLPQLTRMVVDRTMLGRLVGWAGEKPVYSPGVQGVRLEIFLDQGASRPLMTCRPPLPLIKMPRPDQAKHQLSDDLEQ